jgi:hypothetical protein
MITSNILSADRPYYTVTLVDMISSEIFHHATDITGSFLLQIMPEIPDIIYSISIKNYIHFEIWL